MFVCCLLALVCCIYLHQISVVPLTLLEEYMAACPQSAAMDHAPRAQQYVAEDTDARGCEGGHALSLLVHTIMKKVHVTYGMIYVPFNTFRRFFPYPLYENVEASEKAVLLGWFFLSSLCLISCE